MSFLSTLKDSAASPKAAFLQFITTKDPDDYSTFAFVEDDDDIEFYQHVLVSFDPIAYFGCGGKGGVFEVYQYLEGRGRSGGILFMVDRDCESPPFAYPKILRTEVYSWESHTCHGEMVGNLVQRKARPPLSRANRDKVVERWIRTTEEFRSALASHSALLQLRNKPGETVGLGSFRFRSEACDIGTIRPAEQDISALNLKAEEAKLSQKESEKYDKLVARFLLIEIQAFAHGKTLFGILREFLPRAVDGLPTDPLPNINSAKMVTSSVPYDWAEYDYIRQYASGTLSNEV